MQYILSVEMEACKKVLFCGIILSMCEYVCICLTAYKESLHTLATVCSLKYSFPGHNIYDELFKLSAYVLLNLLH